MEQGQVDPAKVREALRSTTYVDYHWVVHPDLDQAYGEGTTQRIVDVLLGMDDAGPEVARILELFEDEAFIKTDDTRYSAIEQVARDLGLIE